MSSYAVLFFFLFFFSFKNASSNSPLLHECMLSHDLPLFMSHWNSTVYFVFVWFDDHMFSPKTKSCPFICDNVALKLGNDVKYESCNIIYSHENFCWELKKITVNLKILLCKEYLLASSKCCTLYLTAVITFVIKDWI